MRRLGVEDKNTDFARRIGLDMHGPSRVGRWRNRKVTTAPDYDATMRILIACGWLNMAEGQPASATENREGDPLVELQVAVDGTFALVQDVRDRMAKLESRLPEARPRRGASARGKTRGGTGT